MSIVVSNKTEDKTLIVALAKEATLPESIIKILIQRGLDTKAKIDTFLNPSIEELASPFLLKDMEKCVALIKETINQGKTIVVYGDYDCDGIGACAIIYLTIKHLNGNINYFIPTRQEDGYGLSIDALDKVIELYKPSLIITVDCGITSIKEVDFVKSKGIDIVITDHHLPLETLPDALIINPKINKNYPDLCGAGVALKLSEALINQEFALSFVDICAISTVADIVPLLDDNRIIVKKGLELFSKNKCRKGIKKLLEASNYDFDKTINTYDIAYKIAPRLNASGRLSSAEKSLKLLIEEDDITLSLIATELEEENKIRQNLCTETIFEGKKIIETENIDDDILILYKEDWEGGVIGIAASKLCEDYYRPTIMLTKKDECYKGSCRSINGINIFELLQYCSDCLIQFGGHSLAAGLSMYPDKLVDFKAKAKEFISKFVDKDVFKKKFYCDAAIDLAEINFQFLDILNKLEPFGYKNPKPNFLISISNGKFNQIKTYPHIKTKVNSTTEIVGFNMYKYLQILNSDYTKHIAITLENEIFQNRKYIKAYIKLVDIAKDSHFNEVLFSTKLDMSVLRDNFKYFYKHINGLKYENIDKVFLYCVDNKYLYSYENFVKAFFIFLESGLVEIEQNTIKIVNKKTNIENSGLFSTLVTEV